MKDGACACTGVFESINTLLYGVCLELLWSSDTVVLLPQYWWNCLEQLFRRVFFCCIVNVLQKLWGVHNCT